MDLLLDGLAFPEGPRWRDGRLWFSDMHARRVMTVDLAGRTEIVAEVEAMPSGLGWLPDGELRIVSMHDRRLLRLRAGELSNVAELGHLASFHCNDMVVDARGHAYVGNFGFDLDGKGEFAPAELIQVTPEGEARVVADDLRFPNGVVVTPDGATLIVAETFGGRLTAFDIRDDGSLENRRVWAPLTNVTPDGICLDAEGACWIASPMSREFLRVREGGEVLQRLPCDAMAIACMLGGPDGRSLFCLTAPTTDPEQNPTLRGGRILVEPVTVPHAGLP